VQRLGRRSNATKVKQRTLWSLNGWVAAVAKSAGAANCGVVAGLSVAADRGRSVMAIAWKF